MQPHPSMPDRKKVRNKRDRRVYERRLLELTATGGVRYRCIAEVRWSTGAHHTRETRLAGLTDVVVQRVRRMGLPCASAVANFVFGSPFLGIGAWFSQARR